MLAIVANKFCCDQATRFDGYVPKFVREDTTVLATVAVTEPVTAVDTEAIGIVLSAGAPALAIPAKTCNLADNS